MQPISDSPSYTQTGLSNTTAVPSECATSDDVELASEQALISKQSNIKLFVVFPIKDTYVDGGIFSGKSCWLFDVVTWVCSCTNISELFPP